MARDLSALQKQYNSSASAQRRGPGGPGGPRGHMGGMGGKSSLKNARKTITRILGYLAKYKLRIFVVLLCMLANTLASLCGSYLLAPIINKLTLAVTGEEQPMSNIERLADNIISRFTGAVNTAVRSEMMSYILTVIVIFAVVYLVGILTSYIQARLMLSISQKTIESLRNDLFSKLQRLPIRYFDSNPTGEIMSRFTNDIDNIDMMINNSLTSIISGTVSLIGTFVFMITTNWLLTLVTVVFIPIFTFGGSAIAKASSKYYSGQQAALGAINGYTEETVTGQKVVKVFNHEDTCVEEFRLLNQDMRNKQLRAQFWGSAMGPIMGNTSQISYGVTIGVGGILMVLGHLSTGALTVFANYSKQFSMPINNISQQTATIFAALAGAERVFEVMDKEPEVADSENALDCPIRGDVVLKDVTFGYNPDKTVLKHISLYAKPGQKIAFVGSTGAGKTTVTNLLNRFYDISDGEILIDGRNIKEYKRAFLRRNIAMVLQDTHLFTGTVKDNIRYGRLDATDEEIVAAAKTASAHSFIMRLEHGYDTVLESDGANLSQGQRQLLNIARAALSNAPILVLDEATSSVDTRTERHIEHGMDRLMKNRTTFVIAHRLSTVRNANAIMVLENGEIIERGDHDDLLAQKGRYYELYTGVKELD
ncbi:MAG TPA: ABC transporter ATP-binding protein [Candidatus Faeciplasma pullistercoris]|uniref:ABC transporter ATP-binding protein n=1 Tax=Candidatus Faeciplasma pullistercoris TaxID=2840800 RepID=A0A9D1GT51_9FIRM|nr:ABC transporter ATP-binding protein [Candidatus Faeciplasma pullistercoris]